MVGTRTRTRLDPEERRRQLVAAATSVFHDRDPSEVTFEEVADAAGVSRALLYNYFGDKGGLVAAVYLATFSGLDDELAAAVASARPGQERLRAVVHCYVSFACANAGVCKLISTVEAMPHPLVRHARQARYDRFAAAWGDAPEGRLLASAMLGLLETATIEWLEAPTCSAERAEDVLVALLWSGLAGLADHGVAAPGRLPA